MSQPTDPLDEEASRTPMWLPAVGLAILFGIAIVIVALPSAPTAQGASTPVAALGDIPPPLTEGDTDEATVARNKPPEAQREGTDVHAQGAAAGANAPQMPPMAPNAPPPGGG